MISESGACPVQIHIVTNGENLWQIARRYDVSIAQIVTANGLPNANQILIGQALVIPLPTRYTVRPGDSVWSIARRYRIPPQSILQANQLTPSSVIYPGQSLQIPKPQKPTIDVNAFTVQFGQTGAQSVQEVGQYLTYVSPFGYRIQASGGLQAVDDAATIQVASPNRIVPMMAITNFSSTQAGTALAHTVLSSTTVQATLLTNVVNTMKEKGYKGLNIDFENVSPDDRVAYNSFLQLTVDRLHPEGYFVSSSLAPKTSASQKGLLYEAHDYPAHGRILDFVVLMTYEWGYRKGPPQAISPINQIKRVLDYAVTAIPRDKILMGFQVYARDWLVPHAEGQEAQTFSMQQALQRAIQYGVTIEYDPAAQSPYYQYTDAKGSQHEVWFEDARSAQAKFNLVKSYSLRGISYWVLGYPFPENWRLLTANFNVRKRS